MKLYCLLTFIFVTAFSFSQTTILVRKQKDRIIAVADTKLGYLGQTKTDTAIKMDCINNICFAAGGIFFRESFNTAYECCKNAKSLDEAVDSFVSKRMVSMAKQFDTLKAESFYYYQKYMYQTGAGVVFFGYENGQYKMKPLTFILPQTLGNKGSAMSVGYMAMGTACDYDTITYAFGFFNAIKDSVCLNETWEKNPEETALRLMRKQIAETPDHVGYPVTFVTIRKQKIRKKTINE